LLLSVGISLAMIMLSVSSAFGDQLDQIKAGVGTDVTVRPAGSGGFFGGDQGTLLTATDQATVASLPHITAVSGLLQQTGATTNLTPAPRRSASGALGGDRGNRRQPAGISVIGVDPTGPIQTLAGDVATIASGRSFAATDGKSAVAVVGQRLADQNQLSVGSTFQLQGQPFSVIGVFTTGTLFGDNALYVPLATAQQVFAQPGSVSTILASVDSADNVDAAANAIRTSLGADKVDVTTSADQFARISAPVDSARKASQIALISAIVASIAVILFVTALATRQRIREIGILKAIGASGTQIAAQFGVETLVVALVAAAIGAAVTFPTAQTVANDLVSVSGSVRGGRFGGGFGRLLGSANVAVSPMVFVYAAVFALVLALAASALPAWKVASVRPAEVLRHE
jgi:putative ABC transport system permease protein